MRILRLMLLCSMIFTFSMARAGERYCHLDQLVSTTFQFCGYTGKNLLLYDYADKVYVVIEGIGFGPRMSWIFRDKLDIRWQVIKAEDNCVSVKQIP